jgi:phenylacetate-coenzyme A ligase PaaK-like adenylate-forming protein
VAKSKLARRSLLPRDLWSLRGVVIVGSDASLYRERLKELWGCVPLDIYGCTEGLVIAVQAWDRQGMTFLPHFNFLEFIPEEERLRGEIFPGYQPSTVLLDEVEVGKNYEVVITNFLGGPFTRYRLGDMVTITSLRSEALGIDLPQMSFYSRCDGLIDLAGFTRLTEKTLWQAVEAAGIPCRDWTVQKEGEDRPVLHLYLELRDEERRSSQELAEAIHQQLKRLNTPYAEMEAMLGLRPVQVTLLQPGSFKRYLELQRANGADLAHLKPAHVNPSTKVVSTLLREAAEVGTPAGAATS